MATQTIYTNKDSHTSEQHASDNFGSSSVLHFDRGYFGRQFYVNFNIASGPSSTQVTDVQIYLYRGDTTVGQPDIDLLRITGSWTETGITWNNAPTTTTTNMIDGTTWTSNQGWKSYTVTDMYKDAKNAGNNFGINVRPDAWGDTGPLYYAHSKENSSGNTPYIVITYGIISDYYVRTTGNDSLSGDSWTNAWKTINKAATTVTDGKTVHIGFGTYSNEPANNKIAPQNIGTSGIYYKMETAGGSGGTGTVIIEKN